MARESFIIYKSFYKPIKKLSNEQIGRLFIALFEYQINGVDEVDEDIEMAFEFFINQFRLDEEKYQHRCEVNKINGSRGGRPRKKDIEDEEEKKPNGLIRYRENPMGAKKPYNDNDNENDNENENGNENVNYNDNNNNNYSYYEEVFGRLLSSVEIERIDCWREKYPEDLIQYAFKIAILNGKRNYSYVNGILRNWDGKTLEEVKEENTTKQNDDEEVIEYEDYDWLNDGGD